MFRSVKVNKYYIKKKEKKTKQEQCVRKCSIRTSLGNSQL